jgi:hypothetical protein
LLSQSYQASLRIDFALSVFSKKRYRGIVQPRDLKVVAICDVAFHAFFQDTKALVAQGVRRDIALNIAAAPSKLLLDAASSRAKEREAHLKTWLKQQYPLSYGPQGGNDIFTSLVQAVHSNKNDIPNGLPNWDHFAMSPYNFAAFLTDISASRTPAPPKAPVLSKGSFLPVLKLAHKALLFIFDDPDKSARRNFVIDSFRKAIKIFKVEYFPAPEKKLNPSAGPRCKTPIFNSWGNLGRMDPSRTAPVAGPSSLPSRPPVEPATVAFNNAIANDCNADWSANALNLKTLKKYLHRTSLPIDFTTPAGSEAPYVKDTYTWVRDNYDGTKPIHHYALLVSIIVASSILPNLFISPEDKLRFNERHTVEDVRAMYDHMDWVSKPRQRGMAQKSIFIAMFTTFIIALYEPQSPLRRHMDDSPKKGLGQDWTEKHSTPFPSPLLLTLPTPTPFSLQPKKASLI